MWQDGDTDRESVRLESSISMKFLSAVGDDVWVSSPPSAYSPRIYSEMGIGYIMASWIRN